MKLLPFSHEYLRLNEPLPFGIYDAGGRLLLSAAQAIQTEDQLGRFHTQACFCDESESNEWRRKLLATVDGLLRKNATVGVIAQARADGSAAAQGQRVEATLPEAWAALAYALDAPLRDPRPDSDWVARILSVHERARKLAASRTDGSLYHLVYHAGSSTERYSANHALLTMLICELAAQRLGWPAAAIDSLGRAALSMNVAMTRLQDQMATMDGASTQKMREDIHAHPVLGMRLLQEGGVVDPVWLFAVRYHHESGELPRVPGEGAAVVASLTRLLRRVDIFTAKLSRRRSRVPMSPVQAAREACLDANGKPDELGAALLKAVGLYPPGSFVELANGEMGIVMARGERANVVWVGTLIGASGNPVGENNLRDTADPRYAVKQAVTAARVRVLPPHERLLLLRS